MDIRCVMVGALIEMLNKELCIRCYNEHRKTKWDKQPAKQRLWDRGKIVCPCSSAYQWTIKNEEIPSFCKYGLEQLLLSKENQ